ncbi:MAG: beta strand repeat-containing protein, partial [Acidobacteriota bacterium]
MLERLKPRYPARVTIILALLITASGAIAQTSTFTYQGRLTDGGTAANGNYDLQFALFDSLNGGAQIGSTQMSSNVPVTAGIFTVQLDFGANTFTGANRFLEIGARPTGSGSFTVLSPRQPVTSTPYAVRSASAASADTATTATSATNATNSSQLGGVAAANYVQTNDSRLSDARSPTPGSPNYIQNTSSQQAASNLNISGNGTAAGTLSANIVNATMQYNIGGNRVLSLAGSNNTFAGLNAGSANTTGTSNSFFGRSAGNNNTTGASNSFFGSNAGFLNTTGGKNSFVGSLAGASNTTGGDNTFVGRSAGAANATASGNSFFGSSAGASNTEGDNNSFFGGSAGNANTTGFGNSFFGNSAGFFNTTGTQNSFFGVNAGFLNTTGISNSFFGIFAGNANTTGSDNTIIGHNADVGGGNLSFATAIGAGAIVSDSNSIVLGRADGSDAVRIPGAVLIDGSLVVKTL